MNSVSEYAELSEQAGRMSSEMRLPHRSDFSGHEGRHSTQSARVDEPTPQTPRHRVRERTAEAAGEILNAHRVVDINIEEEEIGNIIEKLLHESSP